MKRLLFIFALLIPMSDAFARDKSVDCAGRPKWDRFVVDENSDKWDPETAKCFAIQQAQKNNPNLYGSPNMYGNPSDSANDPGVQRKSFYGTYQPTDARSLYGKYDATKPVVTAPAKKSAIKQTNVARNAKPAALPVKPQKSSAKPVQKKPSAKPVQKVVPAKPVATTPVTTVAKPTALPEKTIEEKPVVVAPVPVKVIEPDQKATSIAQTLKEPAFDIDAYCEKIRPAITGPMPKGVVLMPGRPDLMSCVEK